MGKWDFLEPCDAQVHSALATGDVEQAFEILLQGYQGVVVQFCTTLLADAADGEDVAQEVFVAVWRGLPRYKREALLRTWIFRIARNRCRKHWDWRRRQEIQRTGTAGTPGPEPSPSPEDTYQDQVDAMYAQQQLHRLERSLPQLPDHDRLLLMMYYYEELTFRAMARRLWKPEATVRRRVHAAQQRLRALLCQEGEHEEERTSTGRGLSAGPAARGSFYALRAAGPGARRVCGAGARAVGAAQP
jgi:RNA polymerase sigma-70 factor (ECF subfamily)